MQWKWQTHWGLQSPPVRWWYTSPFLTFRPNLDPRLRAIFSLWLHVILSKNNMQEVHNLIDQDLLQLELGIDIDGEKVRAGFLVYCGDNLEMHDAGGSSSTSTVVIHVDFAFTHSKSSAPIPLPWDFLTSSKCRRKLQCHFQLWCLSDMIKFNFILNKLLRTPYSYWTTVAEICSPSLYF